MPYDTLFPGQGINEKVFIIVRRHWWIFFKMFLLYFVLALLPLVLRGLMLQYTTLLNGGTLTIVLKLITSLYYFYILTLFFRGWIDYYLDLGIITSERIVDIEQKGLFARTISEQKLFRVQDVTAEVKGFLPTFFHYGNVHIQTAGPTPRFTFENIPNPYERTKQILDLVRFKKQSLLAKGINPDSPELE